VNRKISKNLAKRKRKVEKRLERKNWENQTKPIFSGYNVHYEIDGRHQAIASGGIGAIQLMNRKLGFIKEVDQALNLLKRHLPYHESDHADPLDQPVFKLTCLQGCICKRKQERVVKPKQDRHRDGNDQR